MTVPATTRRSPVYNGNGVATTFAFTFKVFSTTDVQVLVTSAAGVLSTLILNSDYSVTLNPDQTVAPGGAITYPLIGSPLEVGAKLVIVGALPYDQTLSLPGGGNFNPVVIEKQLDRSTIQIQQLAASLDATIRIPTGETAVALPQAVDRANLLLGFDSSGNPVTVAPTNGSAASLAADLLNTLAPTKGAAMIGFNTSLAYGANTVGGALLSFYNSTGVVKPLRIDAGGGSSVYTDATYISNKAVTTHGYYSFLGNDQIAYANGLTPPVGHATFNDNVTFTGTNGSDHHHSFQSDPHYSAAATLGRLTSFWSQIDATAGTINEANGLKVMNPTGAGTITTLYGVYIDGLTRGVSNWGIYSKAPTVSFLGSALWLGNASGPQAFIEYNGNLGHVQVQPRAGFCFKVGAGAGDRKIRLGDPTDDSTDATIESASDGRLKITPRPGFGIVLNGTTEATAIIASLPFVAASYTVATVPSAATYVRGLIYVSNESGGAVIAFSDGTNWRRVTDRAIVS